MKKIKFALIIILLLVGAWILASILSSQKKDDLRKPVERLVPKESVIEVINEIQSSVINTSGRMYAFNKVEVFAEVSGVLEESSKRFVKTNAFIQISTEELVEGLRFENGESKLTSWMNFRYINDNSYEGFILLNERNEVVNKYFKSGKSVFLLDQFHNINSKKILEGGSSFVIEMPSNSDDD